MVSCIARPYLLDQNHSFQFHLLCNGGCHSFVSSRSPKRNVKISFYSKVEYFKYSYEISQTVRPARSCTYTRIPPARRILYDIQVACHTESILNTVLVDPTTSCIDGAFDISTVKAGILSEPIASKAETTRSININACE